MRLWLLAISATPVLGGVFATGCLGAESCEGMPRPCHDISFQDCEEVSGCVYLSSACAGFPRPCADHPDQESCTSVACSWENGVCTGAPAPCDSTTPNCAIRRDGCTFTEAICGGEPQPCAEYEEENSCNAVAGCTWD